MGAVALLALGLFCGFGFLASFEPGNGLAWKAVYGSLTFGFLAGAVALFRRGVGGKAAGRNETMNREYAKIAFLALVGAAAVLVLQWHFSRAWAGYYSQFPWQGYGQAMKAGHVPAFLTSSPRSLLVGTRALFALSLLTLLFAGARPFRSGLAIWAGAMVSLVGIWIATPQFRQDSNLWPIDLVLLGLSTGLPLMAGALVALVIQKAAGLFRKKAEGKMQNSGG